MTSGNRHEITCARKNVPYTHMGGLISPPIVETIFARRRSYSGA